MTTTPSWLPLVVAGVGVLGTLTAAILTQMLSGRREDNRWAREREAEQIRWERERTERDEQWKREDQARWLVEKRSVYSDYLAIVEKYHETLILVNNHIRAKGSLHPEPQELMNKVDHEYARLHNLLLVMAPSPIIDAAVEATYRLVGLHAKLNNLGKYQDVKGLDISKAELKLRKMMREDLGIDLPEV